MNLHLKIITPRKVVVDEEITSITVPSSEGDMTVLPHHIHLLSLLSEGIITIRKDKKEDYLAIGGGYLETDGKEINILVSRAYKQEEIDAELTEKAIEKAKRDIKEIKDEKQRLEAVSILRRSVINMKLVKRRKDRPQ
jgi:F-type H+-transporting ATPase subunit epsilon